MHAVSRVVSLAKQLLLTVGALLGVVSLALTLVAPVLRVRPLIFLSGSMSPAITTGSLGLARVTPAADLRVGDVVTVPSGDDTFITHRIVEISRHGDVATLRLKGDANREADPTLHQVLQAPRVFAAVPYVGAVVAWLSRAPGVYVLAGYVAFALASLRRRRSSRGPEPGPPGSETDADAELRLDDQHQEERAPHAPARQRRRSPLGKGAMLASLVGGSVAITVPAWGYFLDNASVSGTTLTSGSVPVPTASCGGSSGTSGSQSLTINWTSVTNATGYRVWYDVGGQNKQEVGLVNSITIAPGTSGVFSVQAEWNNWYSNKSNGLTYTVDGNTNPCG